MICHISEIIDDILLIWDRSGYLVCAQIAKKIQLQITFHVLKVTPSYWRHNFDKWANESFLANIPMFKVKLTTVFIKCLDESALLWCMKFWKKMKLLENWEGTTAFLRAFLRGMPERNFWEWLFTGARHLSPNVPVVSNLPHLKTIHHTILIPIYKIYQHIQRDASISKGKLPVVKLKL